MQENKDWTHLTHRLFAQKFNFMTPKNKLY